MNRVYWSENQNANAKDYEDLSLALAFTESLRKRQYDGEDVGFIVISTENPNCVGKRGVDVTDSTYDWKKRRI